MFSWVFGLTQTNLQIRRVKKKQRWSGHGSPAKCAVKMWQRCGGDGRAGGRGRGGDCVTASHMLSRVCVYAHDNVCAFVLHTCACLRDVPWRILLIVLVDLQGGEVDTVVSVCVHEGICLYERVLVHVCVCARRTHTHTQNRRDQLGQMVWSCKEWGLNGHANLHGVGLKVLACTHTHTHTSHRYSCQQASNTLLTLHLPWAVPPHPWLVELLSLFSPYIFFNPNFQVSVSPPFRPPSEDITTHSDKHWTFRGRYHQPGETGWFFFFFKLVLSW